MSLEITSFFTVKSGKALYFYTDKLEKDNEAVQKILYSFSLESESLQWIQKTFLTLKKEKSK